MYYDSNMYQYQCQCPNCVAAQLYNQGRQPVYPTYPNHSINSSGVPLRDYGPNPFVINIDEATKQNNTFRTAIWTGKHLQITLMSINVGESIGLEMHSNLDQFLRIEQGQGIVEMGQSKENLDFKQYVYDDYAIVIPAGYWHNLTNTGNTPLKLYSIYAPPNHPFGTVHQTKADALAAEEGHGHGHGNGNTSNSGRSHNEWTQSRNFNNHNT